MLLFLFGLVVICMTDEIMIDHCKKTLRRIAWSLQYAAKKRYAREHAIINEIPGEDSTSSVISKVYIDQILKKIPERAGFIIKSYIIDGMTEEEIARKLNISKQGVSKCKNKYLRILEQQITPSA